MRKDSAQRQTSKGGTPDTRQTRIPLRLDPITLKSNFSWHSASDYGQHVLSLRGMDSVTNAGHLIKISVDPHPNMHSPLRLIDRVPTPASTFAIFLHEDDSGCWAE
ncbi:hypothetical protein BLNAU_5002 [Blattamonas nauphoetae]|uniref:Uncharacterized protein n=1 Tax=Blattamonas nauphoetae TaxID=2049346 RepID=A0ABQ9Y8V6_9EUKA|nr:hypothetical protein BLNAU_5002 [Blattamonas nauphoetae]